MQPSNKQRAKEMDFVWEEMTTLDESCQSAAQLFHEDKTNHARVLRER